MNKFRVYGSKEIKFYIDVEAEDLISAVRAAGRSESHLWNPMEDDDVIEAYDVIELDEVIDLSTNL
jgi:hypothetical protein